MVIFFIYLLFNYRFPKCNVTVLHDITNRRWARASQRESVILLRLCLNVCGGCSWSYEVFIHVMGYLSSVLKLSWNDFRLLLLNPAMPFRHLSIWLFFSWGVCNKICCHEVRFTSSQYTKHAFAAGSSQTPLAELTSLSWAPGFRWPLHGRKGREREGERSPLLFWQFNHWLSCLISQLCMKQCIDDMWKWKDVITEP